MNLQSLKNIPILPTLFSLVVDRVDNTKSIKIFPAEMIEYPRWFHYGKAVKRVTGLKMESTPGTYETIVSILQDISNSESLILDYGCGQHKSNFIRKIFGEDMVFSADVIPFDDVSNFLLIDPKDSKIAIEDEKFDITIASEVIEHVYNPYILIDELIRLTKRYLIISTPNPQNQYSRSLFQKTGFLQWFGPHDFEYHKSPIFSWQIEGFFHERGLDFKRYANHEFFGLTGNQIEKGETLIYLVDLRK